MALEYYKVCCRAGQASKRTLQDPNQGISPDETFGAHSTGKVSPSCLSLAATFVIETQIDSTWITSHLKSAQRRQACNGQHRLLCEKVELRLQMTNPSTMCAMPLDGTRHHSLMETTSASYFGAAAKKSGARRTTADTPKHLQGWDSRTRVAHDSKASVSVQLQKISVCCKSPSTLLQLDQDLRPRPHVLFLELAATLAACSTVVRPHPEGADQRECSSSIPCKQ